MENTIPQANTPPAQTTPKVGITDAATSAEAGLPVKAVSDGVFSENTAQWVALTFLAIAGVSIIYKIFYYRKKILQMDIQDKELSNQVAELKHNVRLIMKDKYETISG